MKLMLTIVAVTDQPSLLESLQFLVVGFGIVFFALVALAGITWLLGLAFTAQAEGSIEKEVVKPPTSAPKSGLDGRTIAILTAAATTALRRRVRIVGARAAETGRWTQEGRKQIQGSHNLRSGSGRHKGTM